MVDVKDFLKDLEARTETHFKASKMRLSFLKFLDFLRDNPDKALRTSYNYMHSAILSFGMKEIVDCGETIPKYYLFDDPFADNANRLFGTARPNRDLVNEIRSSAMEEGDERLILLRGPPGTSKTTMVDLLAAGLKAYSRTEEGIIFNFGWKFDLKNFFKTKKQGFIGFIEPRQDHECGGDCGGSCDGDCGGSCSYSDESMEDSCGSDCSSCGDDSSFPASKRFIVVPCQINENPLHLIVDRDERKRLLETIVKEHEKTTGKHVNIPEKVLNGELCYNCKQIYDQLLDKYEGNLSKVFSHVVVERFFLDFDKGLVNVVGQAPADVHQKIRTYANDVARLFPKMDFINLFGKWAAANRGIIHFSDIFKSGEDTIHLLDAVEKHRVVMSGITVGIDTLFMATANTEEYEDVRGHKYSGALMDRLKTIDIGYVKNIIEEQKIYRRNLAKVSKKKHIAPHTIEIAALWAVLTRLAKPVLREGSKLTQNQKEYLEKITAMEKVEIYSGRSNYEFNHVNDKKKHLVDDQFRLEMINASNPFVHMGFANLEEGDYGISPRTLQDTFKLILEKGKCLNPLNLIRKIEQIMREDRHFFRHLKKEDAMRKGAKEKDLTIGKYCNSEYALKLAREHYREIITKEVKFSVIDFEEAKLDEIVVSYVKSARFALQQTRGAFDGKVRKEDEEEDIGDQSKVLDQRVLDWVEDLCEVLEEDKDDFRQAIIKDFIEYQQNNPDVKKNINYRNACSYLYDTLEIALFEKKINEGLDLDKVLNGLELYGMEPYEKYDKKVKKHIENLLTKLQEKYEYCPICSKTMAIYVLKEDLLTDMNFPIDEDTT